MDWRKSKNYIILGLLLTNLILLGSIIQGKREFKDQNQLSKEAISNFYALLEQRQITLKEKIPEYPKELPGLQIQYDTMTSSLYPLLFKEYSSSLSTPAHRILRLIIPSEVVMPEQALVYVQEFTIKYFPEEKFAIKNSIFTDQTMSINLTSLYKGYPMEDSSLVFKFTLNNTNPEDGSFLMEMEKNNVAPVNEERPSPVIDPISAVMKQLKNIPPGSSIEAITLVYYNAYNPTAAQTRLAPAVPTWRIRLGNDTYLYEPAFSY